MMNIHAVRAIQQKTQLDRYNALDPNSIPHGSRVIIYAPSGFGKTTFLTDFMRHHGQSRRKWITFRGSTNPSYSMMPALFDITGAFQEGTLKMIIDYQRRKCMKKGIRESEDTSIVIIIDDYADDPKVMNHPLLKFLFLNGRPLGITTFLLSQKYSGIHKSIRENASHLVCTQVVEGPAKYIVDEWMNFSSDMKKTAKAEFIERETAKVKGPVIDRQPYVILTRNGGTSIRDSMFSYVIPPKYFVKNSENKYVYRRDDIVVGCEKYRRQGALHYYNHELELLKREMKEVQRKEEKERRRQQKLARRQLDPAHKDSCMMTIRSDQISSVLTGEGVVTPHVFTAADAERQRPAESVDLDPEAAALREQIERQEEEDERERAAQFRDQRLRENNDAIANRIKDVMSRIELDPEVGADLGLGGGQQGGGEAAPADDFFALVMKRQQEQFSASTKK